MDFDLTEEQEILRKSARDFLAAECPTSLVRVIEENKQGYAVELWQKMAELGWAGLAVPEEFGGSSCSLMDMGILTEELGRALAPVPLITVALCQQAILEAGTREQKSRLLPPMASGKSIMTLAFHDSDLSFDPAGIETMATKKGNHYVLNGTKFLVPFGQVADVYLVPARTERSGQGISLFVVQRDTAGISNSYVNNIASDQLCQLDFKDVKIGKDQLLGAPGEGWSIVRRLLKRGAVLKCAEMVGGSQWVLDKTVDYAKQRTQFDRPIGSFQAVQHRCSNMAIACDGARFVTYQATWLLSEDLPCEREVAIAKAWLSSAYTFICFEAHQAHGAIGFTKEYDLQLYTRRAKAAELAYGDSRFHYDALSTHMGL